MCQDIYNCICQNTKKVGFIIHYVKSTAQLLFKIRFRKGGPTCRRQVVNSRHQTPQGQSVAKPETPLLNIPSWVARCDIKGSVSTMLYPIFSKKVHMIPLTLDVLNDKKSIFRHEFYKNFPKSQFQENVDGNLTSVQLDGTRYSYMSFCAKSASISLVDFSVDIVASKTYLRHEFEVELKFISIEFQIFSTYIKQTWYRHLHHPENT